MLLDRRTLLAALSAALATPAWGQTAGLRFGPARPFSVNGLRALAKQLAAQPYKAAVAPGSAADISYDVMNQIHFRPEDALWRGGPNPVLFFHLSRYDTLPVNIFAVDGGSAREILYRADYFDLGKSGLNPARLAGLGFAGFQNEWLAFQGASYFRSSGQDNQYGASARGIAVNTGLATPEEFPRFSQFWLADNGPVMTVYALLEGPSLTGLYKFDCSRDGSRAIVMDVHCELFFRADISRLGVAPLTSMFWYGENERDKAVDWRPEIHDSDGLAIWTGKGERIWRPLINPDAVQTNSFVDVSPKGFGLMQRDRAFADYQDDGVFYNKRPGIWVEPKSDWGAGAVQLVEIPTSDEVQDNIVAYWRPDAPIQKGGSLSFDYRLYWQDSEPDFPKNLARVIATRTGRGGYAGQEPWPRDRRKFVIDFSGGPLAALPAGAAVKPEITVSRGRSVDAYAARIADTQQWRASFDITLEGTTPIDLRCFLKLGDQALSETWIYQTLPA